MRISDWSSDVCSSDLSERNKKAGAETSGRNIGCLASRALTCPVPEGEPHLPVLRNTRDPPSPWTGGAPGATPRPAAPLVPAFSTGVPVFFRRRGGARGVWAPGFFFYWGGGAGRHNTANPPHIVTSDSP